MGFGAMAADEYILIIPFAARLHRGLTYYIGNFFINSFFHFLFIVGTGLTDHGISPQSPSPGRWQQFYLDADITEVLNGKFSPTKVIL